MVLPVAQARQLAGQRRQLPLEEVAEGLARRVDIGPVAVDEIHRHVERVIGVAFEAHAVLEHEGQDPGAVGVGVGPGLAAVAQETVGPALGERRAGEQCRGDRLQRQRDPELLDHVGFVGEVEIDLHRAGAEHHVQAEPALAGHVGAHDPVAVLGHDRHVGPGPVRGEADAEKADLQLLADRLDLGQVGVDLVAGLVQVLPRRPGELDLAARLQRHRLAVEGERDRPAVLHHRPPPETPAQPLEQGAHPAVAVVGERLAVAQPEAEFLVLGADAPRRRRLAAARDVLDELLVAGNGIARGQAGLRHRHLATCAAGRVAPARRGVHLSEICPRPQAAREYGVGGG